MKTTLFIIWVLISLFCWLYATTANVEGSKRKSFIGRSIFYWFMAIISFTIGYYIGG